ncbi:MAG: PD-(D/E)XK nuclease family protein [Candidatus Aenigmatarchaeota archaeon]
MATKLSNSMLVEFQKCPFAFFLRAEKKVQVSKHIRTVFGSALHYVLLRKFCRKLSPQAQKRRVKKELPFLFPKDKKSAIGIWIRVWREALKEEKANKRIAPFACKIRYDGTTKNQIKEEQEMYLLWGIGIVERYWEIHQNKPLPFAVEFQFSVFPPNRSDVILVGSIDQIIKTKDNEYYLVDLKTGIGPSPKNWQDQFHFHHDLQFTIYSWAFRQIFKKEEAGIIIYPLNYYRNPKTGEKEDREAIITYRNEKDYQDLNTFISFFIACCERGIFPKYYGSHCRQCDYLEICDEGKKLFTSPIKVGEIDLGKINIEEIKKEIELQLLHPRSSSPKLI